MSFSEGDCTDFRSRVHSSVFSEVLCTEFQKTFAQRFPCPQGNADWDSESSQAEAACNLAWAMKVDCVESAARVELTDAIQTRNVQLENDTPPLLHR